MRYGIQNLSQTYFGGPPDIAVAGPNVGTNLGLVAQGSGTVGAATEAVKEGIPGIAFSGSTGSQTAWNAPVQTYEQVYADLSTTVTQALVSSGKPYLPSNAWLNVNYPAVSSSSCSSTSSFKFVLSRINTAIPILTPKDVTTCNNGGRLPTESKVVGTAGCYASISVGVATTKLDASASTQQVVLNKLGSILSCLPA
jgi:5'/3'-nucleotidase SurE